jgi:hypothetical protein
MVTLVSTSIVTAKPFRKHYRYHTINESFCHLLYRNCEDSGLRDHYSFIIGLYRDTFYTGNIENSDM